MPTDTGMPLVRSRRRRRHRPLLTPAHPTSPWPLRRPVRRSGRSTTLPRSSSLRPPPSNVFDRDHPEPGALVRFPSLVAHQAVFLSRRALPRRACRHSLKSKRGAEGQPRTVCASTACCRWAEPSRSTKPRAAARSGRAPLRAGCPSGADRCSGAAAQTCARSGWSSRSYPRRRPGQHRSRPTRAPAEGREPSRRRTGARDVLRPIAA